MESASRDTSLPRGIHEVIGMPRKNCFSTATQQELDEMLMEALLTGDVLKLNGLVLECAVDNYKQKRG